MAACRATDHGWTLRALVAAFLDLALAYLFLWAAALAFVASKLLALFGLPLPCSCDALPAPRRPQQQRGLGCLQGFLLEYPTDKIAGVQSSFLRRFPFHSIDWNDERARHTNCYEVQLPDDIDGGGGGRLLDMGWGEASSASQPPPHLDSKKLSLPGPVQVDGGESYSYRDRDPLDEKGKAVLRQERTSSVLNRRRRRRNGLTIRGKSSPTLPSSFLPSDWKREVGAGSSVNASSHLPQVEISAQVIPGAGDHLSGDQNALVEEVVSATECHTTEKAPSYGSERVCVEDRDESDIISELKRALEEEQAARAALYLELEKERSAAASAADEAMAMILRLQEEKAAIRMEAGQYKRMVEEKSAFDEEEMEILKEIIVRREREKHGLEKEVEAYRQMMLGGDGIEQTPCSDLPDAAELIGQHNSNSFGSSDDPELLLKEVYEFIRRNERSKDRMQGVGVGEPIMACEQKFSAEFGTGTSALHLVEDAGRLSSGEPGQCSNMAKHHILMADDGSECSMKEKAVLTMEVCPSSIQNHRSSYGKESSSSMSNRAEKNDFHDSISHVTNEGDIIQEEKIELRVSVNHLCMRHDVNANKANLKSSQFDAEADVLDVHVVDDKMILGREGSTKQINQPEIQTNEILSAGRVEQSTEDSHRSLNQLELNMHRSSSDVTEMGQSMDSTHNRASWLDLRRSSLPAIDSGRSVPENEVRLLRKMLKVIQQGREMLSLSEEQREKETYNLQLLEEIACQLREFKKTKESGQNMSHASLPPPFSKMAELLILYKRKQ